MPNNIPDLNAPTSRDLEYIAEVLDLNLDYIFSTLVDIRNNFRIQNQILAHMAGVNIEEISNQVTTSPDEKTGD